MAPPDITQVQLRHVRDWLESLREAETTKVKHLNILKAFFSYVISLENPPIKRSPIPKQFRLPKPKDTLVERILSREEVDALIENERNPRNRLMLKMMYLTGIRVSELCGLRWRDVIPNRNSGQITVYGKGGKTRRIRLPVELWQELMDFKGRCEKMLLYLPVQRGTVGSFSCASGSEASRSGSGVRERTKCFSPLAET